MKLSILHDHHGRIIATSRNEELKGTKLFALVGMIPGPDQDLVEVNLRGELLEGISLQELHRQYHVDLGTSELVKNK